MTRMQGFDDLFRQLGEAGAPTEATLSALVLALLSAFVIGQFVAFVYVRTHAGVSYSRAFAQSLVLLTVIAALVMSVIGNSIVAAFGLIGALAIIRFRNVLKDTRDTAFIFLTLVLGMAIGSQRIPVAVIGCLFLMAIAAWLHVTAFGTRGRFDGHLSYTTTGLAVALRESLDAVLRRHCRQVRAVTVHRSGEAVETVSRVRLRDNRRGHEMIDELRSLEGIEDVALVLRDEHEEL